VGGNWGSSKYVSNELYAHVRTHTHTHTHTSKVLFQKFPHLANSHNQQTHVKEPRLSDISDSESPRIRERLKIHIIIIVVVVVVEFDNPSDLGISTIYS
jgi:hypothetical protein